MEHPAGIVAEKLTRQTAGGAFVVTRHTLKSLMKIHFMADEMAQELGNYNKFHLAGSMPRSHPNQKELPCRYVEKFIAGS